MVKLMFNAEDDDLAQSHICNWNVVAGSVSLSPVGAPSGSVIAGAPGLGGSEVSPALAPTGKNGSPSTIAISMQLIVVGLVAALYTSFCG